MGFDATKKSLSIPQFYYAGADDPPLHLPRSLEQDQPVGCGGKTEATAQRAFSGLNVLPLRRVPSPQAWSNWRKP